MPEIKAFSKFSSSLSIKVPSPLLKLDKTLTGILNLLANSTDLI